MKSRIVYSVIVLTIIVGGYISYSFTNHSPSMSTGSDQPLSSFKNIQVAGSWEVYISNGPTTTIRMEGNQEEIDQISYEVKNETLIIKNKKDDWNHKGIVKIYVATSQLIEVSLSGSGLIRLEQKFNNPKMMSFSIAGSGKIEGTVSSPEIHADIAGSGEMILSGDTKKLDIAIAGSGKFDGKNFITDDADIDVAGSGICYLTVNSNLDAEIAGSGHIYYSGNPQVSQEIAGSGGLIRN